MAWDEIDMGPRSPFPDDDPTYIAIMARRQAAAGGSGAGTGKAIGIMGLLVAMFASWLVVGFGVGLGQALGRKVRPEDMPEPPEHPTIRFGP